MINLLGVPKRICLQIGFGLFLQNRTNYATTLAKATTLCYNMQYYIIKNSKNGNFEKEVYFDGFG